MQAMSTAPKDRTILVKARGIGWRRAYFLDCAWLRDEEPTIGDCWRLDDGSGNDIEMADAIGWRPAKQQPIF